MNTLKRSMAYLEKEADQMEHCKLIYSKKAVQRAGEKLIIDNIINDDPNGYKESMEILSNWRSSHVNALKHMSNVIQLACDKIDKKHIVVSRLKRTPSIINKLKRFDGMKLRNMQDIAGCRAILATTKNVYKLRRELNKNRMFKVTDYIENPKEDGYRGIHLIGKYKDEENGVDYPVEIQLRSTIQHSWATAIEIVDLFTNQSLKSNKGEKEWLEFFKLASNEFSKIEERTQEDVFESLMLTVSYIKKLDIYKKFHAFANSLKTIEEQMEIVDDSYNLIRVDFSKSTVNVWNYPDDLFSEAAKNYLILEKEAAKNPSFVVALVSSSSINNLKEAFPNYFADSGIFIKNLKEIEQKYIRYQEMQPNWFSRWLALAGFTGKKE
ncbi:RelA/SpoT domain-containing protein [Shewanella sp. SM73]|uniref:RelA/SpoT domain-containing protein n=1 Tax=Shewanella TaxID=22 RepID=UPI0021D9626E|nr:RelA/SpoT domain-containing protein [Shewanella sp. SM73]MCU8030442.1 RelA/SpoT domain-containing protein [Shewanella sp. SM73]